MLLTNTSTKALISLWEEKDIQRELESVARNKSGGPEYFLCSDRHMEQLTANQYRKWEDKARLKKNE